jgi:hypothetical protein
MSTLQFLLLILDTHCQSQILVLYNIDQYIGKYKIYLYEL